MLPIMCYHCEDAVCVKACPSRAIYKEAKYGTVLVDTNKCHNTRKCWQACPYGSPQYEGDELGPKMSKCNMCIDRLELGLKPICVLSCSMRALEFGSLDELVRKYGKTERFKDMPKDSITNPAVVFRLPEPKKQVIPWDSNEALKLWQKRQPHNDELLPDVFTKMTDVTQAPRDIAGRNGLILKARNAEELMYYTKDDE